MHKSNNILEECLNDLYKLGKIQGEHNINWNDEYNLLKHAKDYYEKNKKIADKYNINHDACPKDYLEYEDEGEQYLWDKMASHLNETIKEHILNIIKDHT